MTTRIVINSRNCYCLPERKRYHSHIVIANAGSNLITKCFILFVFFTLLFLSSEIKAGGISTTCGSLILKDLKIGQTYSLRRVLGKSFSVDYKGDEMTGLKISVQQVVGTSGDYEPVPDINWIRIIKDEFELDPGESVNTDILVQIPYDEKFLGKKYVVNIYPYTLPAGSSEAGLAFGFGLLCKLKLEISPEIPTKEDIENHKKLHLDKTLNVRITPERIFLKNVPQSKEINIKKEYKHFLKIENFSNFVINIKIKSIKPETAGLRPLSPYKSCDDPLFLRPSRATLTLKPNRSKKIALYIKIPKESENKNQYFVLETEISSEIGNIKHYTKVYVETSDIH